MYLLSESLAASQTCSTLRFRRRRESSISRRWDGSRRRLRGGGPSGASGIGPFVEFNNGDGLRIADAGENQACEPLAQFTLSPRSRNHFVQPCEHVESPVRVAKADFPEFLRVERHLLHGPGMGEPAVSAVRSNENVVAPITKRSPSSSENRPES